MPSIFEVLLASINIMETRITQTRLLLDQPDVIIQPPLGHIRFMEFDRAEEIIAIGYEHTQRQLASLPGDTIRAIASR
jgi:NTE family protein